MTVEHTLVGECDPVSKFREDLPEKVTLSWLVEDTLLYRNHFYLLSLPRPEDICTYTFNSEFTTIVKLSIDTTLNERTCRKKYLKRVINNHNIKGKC